MSEEKKFDISPSVAILLSGVLIAGAIVFVNLRPATPLVANNEQLPANVNIPVPTATDHIVGSLTAPIVLVEYSDFECPYCKMVHPTLKRLVEESNGQVAWVYRQYPLVSIHPDAKPAALASECVAEQLGSAGFWKFADTMFANQDKLAPAYYTEVAKGLGVDEAQFASCVASEKYASKLDAHSLEAQQNGGTGTPFTVVISGDTQVPLSGAQPYENFKAVIDALVARQ